MLTDTQLSLLYTMETFLTPEACPPVSLTTTETVTASEELGEAGWIDGGLMMGGVPSAAGARTTRTGARTIMKASRSTSMFPFFGNSCPHRLEPGPDLDNVTFIQGLE